MDRLEEIKARERELHQRAERYQEEAPQDYFPRQQPAYQPYQPQLPPLPPPREPTNMDIIRRISALDKKIDKSLKVIGIAVLATFIVLIATAGGYI